MHSWSPRTGVKTVPHSCVHCNSNEGLKDTQHRSSYPPGLLFPSNSTHSTTTAHQPPCKEGMQLSGCTTSQRKPISMSFQGHLPFHQLLRHFCTTSLLAVSKQDSEDDGHFVTDKNLFTCSFWISLLQLTLIFGYWHGSECLVIFFQVIIRTKTQVGSNPESQKGFYAVNGEETPPQKCPIKSDLSTEKPDRKRAWVCLTFFSMYQL